MAVTITRAGRFRRIHEASSANTQLISTVSAGGAPFARVLSVEVAYSANASVTITIVRDSGIGTAFDLTVQSITLSAQRYAVFVPDEEIMLFPDDALIITCPAGGSGVTSQVAVYLEADA